MKCTKAIGVMSMSLALVIATVEAKVAIVVDSAYYALYPTYVDQYIQCVNVDYNNMNYAKLILFSTHDTLNNVRVKKLWSVLKTEYDSLQSIEGVVLIGDLPWTKYEFVEGGNLSTVAEDYYLMNMRPLDSSGNECDIDSLFRDSKTAPDSAYNWQAGVYDSLRINPSDSMEIWVSRIMGHTIDTAGGLKDTLGNTLDEAGIINEYLCRVIKRMTEQATVPPRAFGMGDTKGFGGGGDDVFAFDRLRLPFEWQFGYPSTERPGT